MLEIYDTCSIGIKKEPHGGVVFIFSDIAGREGVSVMVPVEGKDTAQAIADEIQKLIGPAIAANLQDMGEMIHGSS